MCNHSDISPLGRQILFYRKIRICQSFIERKTAFVSLVRKTNFPERTSLKNA
nr:MAG TPA: hypothetical protein [Herelleviridae sp.]